MDFYSETFTGAQTGTLLVDSPRRIRLRNASFMVHDATSVPVSMKLSYGSRQIVHHPGVPAGGGMVMVGLNADSTLTENLVFDCSAPTGGSCSVTVVYEIIR